MTTATLVRATQGLAIPGLALLQRIDDPLRLCTIYADNDGDMVVGFGGTRANLLDILLNLDPSLEARTLLDAIKRWLYVYQPSKITLAGHSQGGAHALKVAEWLETDSAEVFVYTFGGLPTADRPDCVVTNYLLRRDPMAWVPWWVFGLDRRGRVVKFGPAGAPSLKAHEPGEYIAEFESIEEKGGSPWP